MIKVLFFASLREQVGQSETAVDWLEGMNVAGIWQQVTRDTVMPDNVLIARNQTYCDAETLVADGDEVAFFPPVTGG